MTNNFKYSIELIMVTVLMSIVVIGTMAYIVLYQTGWRYDLNKHSLVNINPVSLNSSITLTLTEEGHTEEYPIDVIYSMMPTERTSNLFYDGSKFNKVTNIPKSNVIQAVKDFVSSVPRNELQKAYITPSCNFIETKEGTTVNVEALTDNIVSNFPHTSTYDVNKFYNIGVDESAEELHDLINKLNACTITYTNGTTIKAIDMEPTFNLETKSISFNEVLVEDAVKTVCDEYDTVNKIQFNFNSTTRGTVSVKSGTYGNLTNTQKEVNHVIETINSLEAENNRKPIMKQEMPSVIPDTYIEVDLENQHVYVYDEGNLLMESDCVTGLLPKRSTPVGVYFISEQMKNKTLRGPGYSSFVNRWMRLTNTGIGLHDATWRSQFGGDIYKHDGSHGCVNLPKQFAYDLYDWGLQHKQVCVIIF